MTAPTPRAGGPVRPTAGARLLITVTGAGLWLTGAVWVIARYFLRRPGEWGPEPSVLEPWSLTAHGAFAFAALWTLGLLWGAHIVRAWATGRRRWTGLILTAWLLLYITDDGPGALVSPTHWIAGLALPIGYALHRWLLKGR